MGPALNVKTGYGEEEKRVTGLGSGLGARARAARRRDGEEFRALQARLAAEAAASAYERLPMSEEAFLDAKYLVQTRAFLADWGAAIVPFVDMCNHASEGAANSEVRARLDGRALHTSTAV